MYGSVQGLQENGNRKWQQDVTGMLGESEAGDQFGELPAACDFNGEIYDDLVVVPPSRTLEPSRAQMTTYR